MKDPAPLIPCPFCGSADPRLMEAMGEAWAFCDACGASASDRMRPYRADTIAAWNRRAYTQDLGDGAMTFPTPGNLALELTPEQQRMLANILMWATRDDYDAEHKALARELLQLIEGEARG